MVRLIERSCGASWMQVKQEMDRLHRGVFETDSGRFVQRTELTNLQEHYLKSLGVAPPRRFQELATKAGRSSAHTAVR